MKTNLKQRGLKLALAFAFVLGATAGGQAFAAATSANTSAEVAEPIAIALVTGTSLDFGAFLPHATIADTVKISTAGVRSKAGTAVTLVSSPVGRAQFNVTGAQDASYSISVTDNDLTSGANTMALTPVWDTTSGASTNPTTGTLDGTGKQSIYVGGDLAVGAAQVAGVYSGTVTVTVDYQ
jgi:spore coat protein U-like protein